MDNVEKVARALASADGLDWDEVCGVNPNRRSRFVGYDDLSPDDFTVKCPKCLGKGVVDYDPAEEIEDWMETNDA